MARERRSPPYPVLTIDEAIGIARTFYDNARAHAIPASSVYETCGFSGKNGSSVQAVGTLRQYDLLTTEITDGIRQTRLSEAALRIIRDNQEDSKDRDAAIRDAARAPEILSKLLDQYDTDLPSDSVLETDLKLKHEYSDKAAPVIVRVLRTNLAYLKSFGAREIVQYNGSDPDDDVIRGVPYQDLDPDKNAESLASPAELEASRPQVEMALAGGGRLVLSVSASGPVSNAEADLVKRHVEVILGQLTD